MHPGSGGIVEEEEEEEEGQKEKEEEEVVVRCVVLVVSINGPRDALGCVIHCVKCAECVRPTKCAK